MATRSSRVQGDLYRQLPAGLTELRGPNEHPSPVSLKPITGDLRAVYKSLEGAEGAVLKGLGGGRGSIYLSGDEGVPKHSKRLTLKVFLQIGGISRNVNV